MMSILSAQTLRKLKPVSPFLERGVTNGMSYGLGPAGYDIRCRENLTLWPMGFGKVSSIEYINLPADVMGFVAAKSTHQRRGVDVGNTKIEPGWRGYLTVEIVNHTWWFKRLNAGDPIAQLVFVRLDAATDLPYRGKYQDQPARPVGAIKEV